MSWSTSWLPFDGVKVLVTNNSHFDSSRTGTGDVAVVECQDDCSCLWDGYVRKWKGTYCHLYGWKRVLAQAYGLKMCYLSFRAGSDWLGLLPAAVLPRFPGGQKKAVSLAFCNYGGLLCSPEAEKESLKARALQHLAQKGIRQVEFRDISTEPAATEEVTMVLSLPDSPELLWKQIGSKVRNQIQKARQSGLTIRWGTDQGDILYTIYAKNMGRLGTPVHSFRFVRETLDAFPDHVDVLTVQHAGKAIGGMLLFREPDRWSNPLASCLSEFNSLNPNMLLYWEALRAASQAGAQSFDFGRSRKKSGTYNFKKQWGTKEVPLDYHCCRNTVRDAKTATAFYRSPKAALLADIWRKLPFPLQVHLGPMVRRWMP